MKLLIGFLLVNVMVFAVLRRRSLPLAQVSLFGLCLAAAAGFYIFNML